MTALPIQCGCLLAFLIPWGGRSMTGEGLPSISPLHILLQSHVTGLGWPILSGTLIELSLAEELEFRSKSILG